MAEQVDDDGGKPHGSLCQQKRGRHVLVRKLTSQSTDPVALFFSFFFSLICFFKGVNVHSRGVDVFDAGVLLRFVVT